MNKGKILIVDDDEFIRLSLRMLLEQHYELVKDLDNPAGIPTELDQTNFDVVLLDMNFTQGDQSGQAGLKWLGEILKISRDCQVILMTAYGGVSIAVEAIKHGAVDFVVKPWQNEKLLTTVLTAFRLAQEKRTVKQLKSREKFISSSIDQKFTNIIGASAEMHDVFRMMNKVAKTSADVLILGENGTGKELVARAIHRNSPRSEAPFISVDLGALSETLFESELFGHKRGAFTDAKEDRIGRIEAAAGGTLFFDEIGNLSLPLQAKLLSVLQGRTITRLGTNDPIEVDVRIICATNGSLIQLVKDGAFREDLLYRIKTVEITLPPLRDRLKDIPLLAKHFGSTYSKKYLKAEIDIPNHVLNKLKGYRWPGNVRELQHAIERAVILCEAERLDTSDFTFLSEADGTGPNLDNYNLENLEKWAVMNAIKKHSGNISHAASELGLSRGAMYRRMEKYEL